MSHITDLTFLAKSFRFSLALALVLIATSAQAANWTCEELGTGDPLLDDERRWFQNNCTDDDEDEDDGGGGVGAMEQEVHKPPVDTCSQLPADIVVNGYRPFSTQCQQIGGASVGNPELRARGILNAVDVWGDVSAEIQVCFRQGGRLYFLDAATAPRAVSDLGAERIDGMTCGTINRAGTVTLLPAAETAAETSDSPPAPAQTDPASSTICQLETTGYLSLRAGPSTNYARLLSMPRGERLVARARIGDWFMVNYEGQWGWASGEYLAASPGCDALGDERALILLPTMEPSASEAEAEMADTEEAMPDADASEMMDSVEEAPADCRLTAVDHLNLRAGPGLDYEVLAEIPYQASLSATAESNDWFKVEYMSQAGWVSREYVFRWGDCHALGEAEAMMPPPAMEAETDESEMTVPDARPLTHCNLRSGDIINLRQGPGLDYGVVAEIPNETNLMTTARTRDWFKVAHEAAVGWVHIDYVFRNGACG